MKNKIKEYFEEAGEEALGREISGEIEVQDKLEGAYNMNYPVSVGGEKFLMRISPIRGGRYKEYEYKVLKLMEGKNIGPVPYHLDTSRDFFDYPFLIEEWIQGDRIRKLSLKDMRDLAELFHKINSLESKELKDKRFSPENFAEKVSEQIEDYSERNVLDLEFFYDFEDLVPKLVNYMEERKGIFPQEEPIGLSNTDMKVRHIIRTDSGFKVVDWEYAGLDYGSHDIGEFFYHLNWRDLNSNEKKRREFVEEYKNLSCIKNLSERTRVQEVVFSVAETLWCMNHMVDLRENKVPDSMMQGEKIENYREIVERNIEWMSDRLNT